MPGILNEDSTAIDSKVFRGDSTLYKDAKSLDRDLARIANDTLLRDIPKPHMLAHSRLTKILRGTTWSISIKDRNVRINVGDAWPNFFDDETQCITINIPLKMKLAYKSMSKATGDYIWSKALGGSFWARDRGHRRSMTDLILPWAFRHEYGHSIDYLTQFMNRYGSRREFGGWVSYTRRDGGGLEASNKRQELVQDVLVGVCRERRERPRSVEDCRAATSCLVNFITQRDSFTGADYRRTIETTIAGITDAGLRSHMERVWRVIDDGAKQPWLRGDLLAVYVIDQRVYSYNGGDGAWFSFDASAYRRRVSNYQFGSPSEWFAEYYSARYAENTGPAMHKTLRDHMDGKVIDEIDDRLRHDCAGSPSALRPFKWSDGDDSQFNAKQSKYIGSCVKYRREDGTFNLSECKSCQSEASERKLRTDSRDKLLGANILCGTCAPALATSDILAGVLPALCNQCDTSVAAQPTHSKTWTDLRDRCKRAFPSCPKRHWTPTPINSFDGLLPCPWYDV